MITTHVISGPDDSPSIILHGRSNGCALGHSVDAKGVMPDVALAAGAATEYLVLVVQTQQDVIVPVEGAQQALAQCAQVCAK